MTMMISVVDPQKKLTTTLLLVSFQATSVSGLARELSFFRQNTTVSQVLTQSVGILLMADPQKKLTTILLLVSFWLLPFPVQIENSFFRQNTEVTQLLTLSVSNLSNHLKKQLLASLFVFRLRCTRGHLPYIVLVIVFNLRFQANFYRTGILADCCTKVRTCQVKSSQLQSSSRCQPC